MVSWDSARTRTEHLFRRLAGTPQRVTAVHIVGEKSTRVVADNATVLRNIEYVRIVGGSAPDFSARITQEQIDAVSQLKSVHSIEMYGSFDPRVRLDTLSRIPTIERLDIVSDFIPYHVIDDLGLVNVDFLWLLCEYDEERDNRLPSEAFRSFSRSSCTKITIFGVIDDRALEYIASAPQLDSLTIERTGAWDKEPQLTDEGLCRASKRLHLRTLQIGGTSSPFTEASAECLAAIKELQSLNISLTPAAQERLKVLRPDL
jgi:hypothetical protein